MVALRAMAPVYLIRAMCQGRMDNTISPCIPNSLLVLTAVKATFLKDQVTGAHQSTFKSRSTITTALQVLVRGGGDQLLWQVNKHLGVHDKHPLPTKTDSPAPSGRIKGLRRH